MKKPADAQPVTPAHVTITAEFDLGDGSYLGDVQECIAAALDKLREQVTINHAKFSIPAITMDMK